MHILFLTDNFPPEVNAPASRTFEHCREWVKAGHQVTVITCAPNFPNGRVFKGYRNKFLQSEDMAGIHVIRVWSYITANEGFVKRIIDYISFLPPATIASLFVRKPDIVIGTSPQFFTVCGAYIVSRLKRIPFVFELRDIWPESIKAVGAMDDSIAIRLLEKIEVFLYGKASVIVSVTYSFKRRLIERGVCGDKIQVVTNGVDLSRFSLRPKNRDLLEKLGLEGDFVAGYIGTHGMAHHLETILEAAVIAKLNKDRVRFLLLGNGASKMALMDQAKHMELDNVLFIDSVPKEQVVQYWSLLDVSIIHLKKTELFKAVIPSKLFECMAMGVPILHGVAGESADIVEDYKVGVVFKPENAQQLYRGVTKLQRNSEFYQSCRDHCLKSAENFDRSQLAARMLGILEKQYVQFPNNTVPKDIQR